MTPKRFLIAWLPVALWLCVIAFESTEGMGSSHTLVMIWRVLLAVRIHISFERLQILNFALRKSGHFIGYGVLGVLFVRAWLLSARSTLDGRPLIARALALGLVSTLIVSSADEIHQLFLPGRTGAAHDVALDMLGAALLVGLTARTLQRRAPPSQSAEDRGFG